MFHLLKAFYKVRSNSIAPPIKNFIILTLTIFMEYCFIKIVNFKKCDALGKKK